MIFKKNNVKRTLPRKIIDAFIYFFLGVFLLLILFFGFSQTSTFRNIVRDKILKIADETFLADFHLGTIDGTILTSLALNDVSLVKGNDTLFAAKKIDVGLNPFPLLIRELDITKFKLHDVNVNLKEEESGKWNISDVLNPDSSLVIDEVDTLKENTKQKGKFPFNIKVDNLTLDNVNIIMKKYPFRNSNRKYNTLNFDDLSISNFNLQASIFANVNSREFDLTIDSLFFSPNLNRFNLKNLSGNFQISQKFAEVKDLSIITDSSSLNLSARLDSVNLFGNVDLEEFKNYPLTLTLRADPIAGSDLSSFLEPLDFIKGRIKLSMDADGKFGNFNQKINLAMDKTNLTLDGALLNLNTPEKLYIKANFSNSNVDYDEVDKLLAGLDLPSYPDLFVENLNLKYEGEPLKFNASGDGKIDDGEITFSAFMNMYPDLIEYDYSFTTNNIDLNSTIGINSNINSRGEFKGKGFNPSESTSRMDLYVYNSFLNKYYFDSLDAKLQTTDKLIDLEVSSDIDSIGIYVSGLLDLAENDNPIYNLQGNFKNLDLADITDDPAYSSSLNFEFAANGHSLDINKTEGSFILNFINSQIGQNQFDSVKFRLDVQLDKNQRDITLKSDLLDFNLSGEYNLNDAYKLFKHEVNKISYSISNKLTELNPLAFDSTDVIKLNELKNNEYIVENELYLDYNFEFKDFRIIAALVGQDEISISGVGDGYIENDSSNFSMSINVDLDYLFLFKGKDVFYISDVAGNMNIGADNKSYSFNNIFGAFSFDSKRIVSGININNLSTDIVFNQSRIYYNIAGDVDEAVNAKLNGNILISDSLETITMDNFAILYNDFTIENHEPLVLVNSPQQFTIEHFLLYNDDSKFSIDGYITKDLTQDIQIQIRNLHGGLLGKNILNFKGNNDEVTINLLANITGTAAKPIISADLAGEDIIVDDKNLGSLYIDFNYEERMLATNAYYTDTTKNTAKPLLSLEGGIPIYIGNDPDNNTLDSTKHIQLKFITKEFNIASLGNIIPTITNQKGILNSEINISGSQANLNYDGYMKLKKSSFTAEVTNMNYGLDLDLNFNKQNIDIRKFTIRNLDNGKFNGTMKVSGAMTTDGLGIGEIDLNMNGDIALLGQRTKETMRNLYGNFFIGSENSLNFKYKNHRSKLSGTIVIKEANLNFVPTESSYSVTGSDFKYVFVVDSSTFNKQREKYEKLLTALSLKYRDESKSSTLPRNLDLDLLIKSENISKITVVLSKALNQKLIADISGNIRIGNQDDKLLAQGQFDILPSSMFSFYKTFRAEGNIKFTSDLTDPILNITATYLADYVNNRDREAEPVKTAVKIKVNDKVSTLRENIASGENPINMKIYMGQKNIDYDVASNQYNNLDAMYFILFGTFSSDINNADLANSAAMSVLGSTLTTMLNANFGDVINNVNLNQSGNQTRFNISGRVQKVRYTVGGTQEVFSDLSQANARVEYLFSPKLIFRAERKDPVISSSSGNNDKISEFGVKYRFSF